MPSEHLRAIWREASRRYRARRASVPGLSGPARKAHVPPASHPWRVARDDQEELQPEPHIPDLILRELGIWGRVDHG